MTDASAAGPDDDDVDLTLRHLTRCFPEELARALLPGAKTLAEVTWLETQVAERQRRTDRWAPRGGRHRRSFTRGRCVHRRAACRAVLL